jgi:hypothetical protein
VNLKRQILISKTVKLWRQISANIHVDIQQTCFRIEVNFDIEHNDRTYQIQHATLIQHCFNFNMFPSLMLI